MKNVELRIYCLQFWTNHNFLFVMDEIIGNYDVSGDNIEFVDGEGS